MSAIAPNRPQENIVYKVSAMARKAALLKYFLAGSSIFITIKPPAPDS
jgi:hypothetical protein